MTIAEEKDGDLLVLKPAGKLDSDLSPELEEVLFGALDRGEKKVLVDMARISYISSRGLRVFLVGAKRAKAAGARIVVCSLQEFVKDVFRMSGFFQLLDAFDSALEAAESFDSGPGA